MPSETMKKELDFALRVARQAAKVTQKVYHELVKGNESKTSPKSDSSTLTKKDASPVTVGDYACQAIFGHFLAKEFPQDSLVGEEDAADLRCSESKVVLDRVRHFVQSVLPSAKEENVCSWIDHGNGNPGKRFWTLDPIDGTKGFLRGDQYAVALALLEDFQVKLAVLACPNLNESGEEEIGGSGALIWAIRGEGSWITSLAEGGEKSRLKVSKRDTLREACFLRSFEAAHTNSSRTDKFMKAAGLQVKPKLMDSQAKYAVLAAGHGELFFYLLPQDQSDYRMKIWDVAPGALVVEEAGGRITDLKGNALDFSAGLTLLHNPGLLITNGLLHEQALEFLQKVQATA